MSTSEKLPPRRSNLGKISVRYEFIRILWFFWRSYRWCKNCIYSLKSIWTNISDWVWRNIFCRLFCGLSFLKSRRKYTAKKNLQELSHWEFNYSQGKNQSARMLEQLCTTQAVADLHLNQQDVKMFANTENSIIINKGKHENI